MPKTKSIQETVDLWTTVHYLNDFTKASTKHIQALCNSDLTPAAKAKLTLTAEYPLKTLKHVIKEKARETTNKVLGDAKHTWLQALEKTVLSNIQQTANINVRTKYDEIGETTLLDPIIKAQEDTDEWTMHFTSVTDASIRPPQVIEFEVQPFAVLAYDAGILSTQTDVPMVPHATNTITPFALVLPRVVVLPDLNTVCEDALMLPPLTCLRTKPETQNDILELEFSLDDGRPTYPDPALGVLALGAHEVDVRLSERVMKRWATLVQTFYNEGRYEQENLRNALNNTVEMQTSRGAIAVLQNTCVIVPNSRYHVWVRWTDNHWAILFVSRKHERALSLGMKKADAQAMWSAVQRIYDTSPDTVWKSCRLVGSASAMKDSNAIVVAMYTVLLLCALPDVFDMFERTSFKESVLWLQKKVLGGLDLDRARMHAAAYLSVQ